MLDLAILGGKLVIPEEGILEADVGVAGERVALIGVPGSLPEAARTVDASGLHVLPGVIDPHTHFGAYTPFERDVEYETRAALAGGVTTIGIFVRSSNSYHEVLGQVKDKAEQHASTDFFFHPIIGTELQLSELESYVERWGVTSFKAYMAGMKGVFNSVSDGFLLDLFRKVAALGKRVVVCVHTENEAVVEREEQAVAAAVANTPGGGTLADWARAHPDIAEEEGLIRCAFLAELAGASIYAVHLGSARAADRARLLKKDRSDLYVETISHSLSLTIDHPQGTLVKRSPPVRTGADVEALWRAVADGTIDTLGTDNVVGSRQTNRSELGMFGAKVGFTALGTHLPVVLSEGYHRRGVDLLRLVETMSSRPARLFNLYPRKGTIAVGSDADLALVDLGLERRVRHEELHSWADFSPWDGEVLRGWPVATILRGRVAVERNQIVVEPGAGRYLSRSL